MQNNDARQITTRSSSSAAAASVDEDATETEEETEENDDESEESGQPKIRKPYFVYLMACNTPQQKQSAKPIRRMLTHIGKSREPVRKVIRHNEGVVNLHKRSTKISPMRWHLEEWVGPFPSRKYAREFQRSWFSKTKGAKTRIEKGIQLAGEHKVICYTPRALEIRQRR